MIFWGLAGLVVMAFFAVKVVRQGHEYTLERLGRYSRTLKPGLHFILPFVERIGVRLNVQGQAMDIPDLNVITRDKAMVQVNGLVFFQVTDAAKAAYEVNNHILATLNLATASLCTLVGSTDLDELLSRRDQVNARLLSAVDEATRPWGVKVTRIEIKDITPSADIVQLLGRQMMLEREKQAHIPEVKSWPEADAGDNEVPLHSSEAEVWGAAAAKAWGDREPPRATPTGKRRTGGWPEGSIPED